MLYIYIYRFPVSLSTIWGYHLPVNFMFKFPISTIWRNHLPFDLTSKWKGTFQYFQINDFFLYVANRYSIQKHEENIKWKRIVFLKNNYFFLFPELFFGRNVGNSIQCKKNITPPPHIWDFKKSEHFSIFPIPKFVMLKIA